MDNETLSRSDAAGLLALELLRSIEIIRNSKYGELEVVVEREWETVAGYAARAIRLSRFAETWRCGYVQLPDDHPQAGEYDDYDHYDGLLRAHGGVTYCNHITGTDGFWIGFDCNHACDSPSWGGYEKPLEYVVAECESLAAQLARLAETPREGGEQ